jgi:hypothetical protein
MKFILIIFLIGNGYSGTQPTSVEFNSKEACVEAGEKFRDLFGNKSWASYICTGKGVSK